VRSAHQIGHQLRAEHSGFVDDNDIARTKPTSVGLEVGV